MTGRFDYFVVFAEMRTGSNFLEANINQLEGLACYGEVFNPAFIGYPTSDHVLGVTKAQREDDPFHLITAVRDSPGVGGFRYFRDHDPRVLETILDDPRCAKIILTRNPADSFVSLLIARATGQWKLTNVKHLRQEKVLFDPEAFASYVADIQDFQVHLLNSMQRSGQTAFYITYEDLQDVAVINGLAAFLGCDDRLDALDGTLKPQNPEPLTEKVQNPDEMIAALSSGDRFNLTRTPNFEPRRGPRVRHYLAAAKAPLLYLPLPGGPDHLIREWLSHLDDGADPRSDFTRRSLREWKAQSAAHRSFTIVRHPLARAHIAFCEKILPNGDGGLPDIRRALGKVHGVPLPATYPADDYDDAAHAAAFTAFLQFLKKNLSGQTGVRVDASWASQTTLMQGLAEICLPDMIVREARLQDDLAILCSQIGRPTMPQLPMNTDPHAARLARTLNPDMEEAARAAYQQDYINFGFGDWKGPTAP